METADEARRSGGQRAMLPNARGHPSINSFFSVRTQTAESTTFEFTCYLQFIQTV
jgi:hypothetical protein